MLSSLHSTIHSPSSLTPLIFPRSSGSTGVSTNHGNSCLYIVRHISLTEVRKGSQVRGIVWTDIQEHKVHPLHLILAKMSRSYKVHLLLHLLGETHKDWVAHVLYIWWGILSMFLGCWSVSGSLLLFGLVDTVGFLFGFFETGFLSVYSWLSCNSLCRPGWPWTQKSTCLCLPSAGIKGVYHHCSAANTFLRML